MCCNPNLLNPYDCEEQTQIQAFIRWPSSPSRAVSPANVNSKACADWRNLYKFKFCRFKRQVLRQANRTLISSRLHSSQIATCRVSGEVCLNDAHERIGKIIWKIFSAINNLNSALHLLYSTREDCGCNASSFGLIWYCFWNFCNK